MKRVAALCAAASLALAPAAAAAQPVITPGTAIATRNPAGTTLGDCTLGFLATGDGADYALTAGHCNAGGEVLLSDDRRLGQFTRTVNDVDPASLDLRDVGLIHLDASDLPPLDPSISARIPVTGVLAEPLTIDDTLCTYGARTGHERCGRVAFTPAPGDSTVQFGAASQPGDSGSPVYRVQKDGSAQAVGILIRGEKSVASSQAMLIGPYLREWNLTLATTPPTAAARSMRGVVGLVAVVGLATILVYVGRLFAQRRRPVRRPTGLAPVDRDLIKH
jgi:hypothetical protein